VRTEPIIGPTPDPQPPLDDDDWAAVSGLAAVSPSQDVLAAMEEAARKTSDFEIDALKYRRIQARPAAARVDEDPEEGLNARMSMDAARDRALEAISEAQRAMREELAEL
jgi:hypothetical protein